MKKVIDVNIGRVNFSIEDDAYLNLKSYLDRFEATLTDKNEVKDIMEDVEIRVAEIFSKEIKYPNHVVDQKMVNKVIYCLGEIESSNEIHEMKDKKQTTKRLFRNADDKKIAGVCSGLSIYFNVDVTLIRIIFVVALIGYGSTLWIYGILWVVVPLAQTIIQKLEMRGEQITPENIKKYTYSN